MHEHSLLYLLQQDFGLLCFCKADKETNKLEVRKSEIHHFCATVTALDTSPKFSIAPDFISGELMFAAD